MTETAQKQNGDRSIRCG